MSKRVMIIGSTGFMGRALTERLLNAGHRVDAVVRPGSENKVIAGARAISADPLDHRTYISFLSPEHTLVQLAGVAHPGPHKKDKFEKIDFVCGRESVLAARSAHIEQFVYVSVAQPLPIMRAYASARAAVEALIVGNKLNATVLRPFYVLGPGRWWPVILTPLYWVFGSQSATRATAQRLGLVTLKQMVDAMVRAIERPTSGLRIWEVPDIQKGGHS